MVRFFLNSILFLPILFISCNKRVNTNAEVINKWQDIKIRIDSIGEAVLSDGKIKGFSVAIMVQKDTIYNRGFGFMDSVGRNPVTTETKFLMASISKLMTAIIVMKLIEEDKLSLDQTLVEVLPEYPNSDQAKQITIKHLLTHTSGIPDYVSKIDSIFLNEHKDPTKNEIISFFKGKDLEFEPGTAYNYSNAGYKILSWIVENMTSAPFESQVNRVINDPLKFNLDLIRNSASDPRTSVYFELLDSTLYPFKHWLWIEGDGGLTTTAIELAHFPIEWASGKIVNQETYEEMIQPTDLGKGLIADYGLGVNIGEFEGEKIIGHAGGYKTVKSMMVYFPARKTSIVVLVNTDNTPANARNIFGKIALAVLEKGNPDKSAEEVFDLNLETCIGTYTAPGINDEIYIQLNDNDKHLYYTTDTLIRGEKLYNLGDGRFWTQNWPLDAIIFDFKKNDEVVGLREYYTGQYGLTREKVN